MHAIGGIDHRNIEVSSNQMRRAGVRMSKNQQIKPDGAQGIAGIEQRFALFDAGAAGVHDNCHRTQRFGGYFERGSGASGSLVKHQPNALATQQRPRLATLHAARQAEYFKNFFRFQMFDSEQRSPRKSTHAWRRHLRDQTSGRRISQALFPLTRLFRRCPLRVALLR